MTDLWLGLPLFLRLLAVFLLSMYLTMLFVALRSRRPDAIARSRLAALGRRQTVPDAVAAAETAGGAEAAHADQQVERRIRRLIDAELSKRTSFAARLARKLRRADVPLRISEFLTIQVVAAVLSSAVLLLLARSLIGAVLGGLIGLWLPHLYLSFRTAKRLRQFHDQLPEALTLMANALKTGYSFLQAADVVARELPDPISTEFGQVIRETRVNITLEDALANLLDRVESSDLDLVVTAVLINNQVGGNLSHVLDSISTTIRRRIRLRGQIRSLTAQGRLSGMVIGALPMALAAVILVVNREFMQPLFNHPLGLAMVFIAVVMQVLGYLVIRRIVRVEV